MPTPGKRKKVDLTGPTWEESSSCIGWTVLRDFAFCVGFDLQDLQVSPGFRVEIHLWDSKALGIQITERQRIIGVYNHLQNAKYLGSMKPFSV